MTRVLIADDHPVFRQGLRALLESLGHDVVAVVADGVEAVRETVIAKPEVVLLDLQMPNVDGLAALREIARVAPDVPVCVLTMHEDDEALFAAMRAGARGYLLKGAEQEEIAQAVTGVAAGGAVFGAGVARRVLRCFSGSQAPVTAPFPQLSDREREILGLLAGGMPNGAIARKLSLSPKTVSNNVSAILTKLHVVDRAQAAIAAREAGLGR
ncbi:MAG TPA: response regulator transcription factor [Mycobacteriales bacterium]|nr:response regulator transcription factor [Mycobacteriales bacterium]